VRERGLEQGISQPRRARVARRLERKAPHRHAAPQPRRVISSPTRPPDLFILPPLFPYQEEFVTNPAWELVTVSARQLGKTFACACWLLAQAWEHPETLNWWCAPTLKQARIGYRRMKSIAQSAGILLPGDKGFTDFTMTLRVINGATIECRTWKNPDHLQGESIYALVVDEAGLLTSAARAMMSSGRAALLGPARYIGNPGPTGSEFWTLHHQATEGKAVGDGYWDLLKWTWETRRDALAPQQRIGYQRFIDDARRTMAPFQFSRLFEADWAIPEKSIFGASISKLANGGLLLAPDPKPHPGHPYVVGWDIGVTSDYTVGAPLCLTCFSVTDFYRDRPGTTDGLATKMVDYTRRWNDAQMVIEKNGLGITTFNDAARLYKRVQGWQTDNVNKRTAVFEVLNRLENGGLTLPKIPAMLTELTDYESQQNSKTQTWTFGAPTGGHDDIVMALLIAVGSATSGGTAYIEMMKRQLAKMRDREQGKQPS
jgi:Terminase large subunit, T4likevirus-type, N-terminal